MKRISLLLSMLIFIGACQQQGSNKSSSDTKSTTTTQANKATNNTSANSAPLTVDNFKLPADALNDDKLSRTGLIAYLDGKKFTGQSITYFSDNKPQYLKTYNDGKMDGEFRIWYDNGNKHTVGQYKGGVKFGKWTVWNNNVDNDIYKDMIFKDGQVYETIHY